MTEGKHTPTPWAFNEERNSVESRYEHGWANDGWIICICDGPDTEHNGKFIVRAVNVHDEMLAALKAFASDDLRERLLDAQQDINFHANTTMAQSVADASSLIDEIDRLMAAAQRVVAKAEGKA